MVAGAVDERFPKTALARDAAVTVRPSPLFYFFPGLGKRLGQFLARKDRPLILKLAKIDLLDRRVSVKECRPGIKKNGANISADLDYGITWPPSRTIACPVRFRASSEAM